jgi:hypothetical protein
MQAHQDQSHDVKGQRSLSCIRVLTGDHGDASRLLVFSRADPTSTHFKVVLEGHERMMKSEVEAAPPLAVTIVSSSF